MKATGVIRRIDDLGRIVIPKEIRKNFKINEGENIEIFVSDNDSIILKKHSTLSNINELANVIVSSFNQIENKILMITDNSNIITTGKKIEKYELTDDYFNIIKDRNNIILDKSQKFIEPNEGLNYMISPLILNGDLIGGIILISNEEIKKFDEKVINLINKILINYIEQ